MTIEFTEETFNHYTNQPFYLGTEKPVLVQFTATWCGPCKAMAPIINQLATEFVDQAVVGKVDVDDLASIAQQYQIRGVPTFIVFKYGEIVARKTGGSTKKELTELLNQVIGQ